MPLIPLDWLAQHVAVLPGTDATALAAALVKVGLEEEEIHAPEVSGPIVVGKVLTLVKEEQKNGKLINYCRVDVGAHNDAPGAGKEVSELASRGIICGAHNFVAGDYVVVSLPGAILPGDFQIASRKTYGHISDGMICSARELGLGQDHDGIIVLAHSEEEAVEKGIPAVGEDVLPYLGLAGEVLEINVTPDRGYCFSMRGVAREYAHSTGAKFVDPALHSAAAQAVPASNNLGFAVEVSDTAPIYGVPGCDRFVTRIVRGVNPQAPSPKWLQDRLTAAGMRPISLAVDATNYVMLDLGQPLHAYDLAKVVAPLVVRRAKTGETLETLDGTHRTLTEQDLVIADSTNGHGARVIGLAGVMGGASTEITADTVDVLIEAAHFDAVSVARAARAHRIPSEAAKRFERGVDPLLPAVAAQAVADLLVTYGGGQYAEENYEINTVPAPAVLTFPLNETKRLTGLDLPRAVQIEILEAIGCLVTQTSETVLEVTPPTWRPDLVGAAHLVEEITRLHGYEQVASVVPAAPAGNGLTLQQRQRRDVARTVAEQGWVEVLSYPFVGRNVFDKQGIPVDDERRVAIRLKNPLQDEAPLMRTSILDSLLRTAQLNVARGNTHVAVYEHGKVTRPNGIIPACTPQAGNRPDSDSLTSLAQAVPAQPYHIAGVASSANTDLGYGFDASSWDWRDALEIVKRIGATIGVHLTFTNTEFAPYHPGRCGQVWAGSVLVGYAGELAPKVCKAFELPARSIAFEIDLDALCLMRGTDPIQVNPVATFPVAKEDIALVVDETVTVAQITEIIVEAAGSLLEDVRLFDIYQGSPVPTGKKSLAFALRLRGQEQTLTAEETATIRNRIVKLANKTFGAQLRS